MYVLANFPSFAFSFALFALGHPQNIKEYQEVFDKTELLFSNWKNEFCPIARKKLCQTNMSIAFSNFFPQSTVKNSFSYLDEIFKPFGRQNR